MNLRSNAPQPGIPIDCEGMKASGFRNAGILVVDINDHRLSWVDQEELKRIGAKIYGSKGR
jgi:hypothetical protein